MYRDLVSIRHVIADEKAKPKQTYILVVGNDFRVKQCPLPVSDIDFHSSKGPLIEFLLSKIKLCHPHVTEAGYHFFFLELRSRKSQLFILVQLAARRAEMVNCFLKPFDMGVFRSPVTCVVNCSMIQLAQVSLVSAVHTAVLDWCVADIPSASPQNSRPFLIPPRLEFSFWMHFICSYLRTLGTGMDSPGSHFISLPLPPAVFHKGSPVTRNNLAWFSNSLLMVLCSKFNFRMDCLHFPYKSPF